MSESVREKMKNKKQKQNTLPGNAGSGGSFVILSPAAGLPLAKVVLTLYLFLDVGGNIATLGGFYSLREGASSENIPVFWMCLPLGSPESPAWWLQTII